MFAGNMYTWNGITFQVVPDRPKMQLSADCPVTDDYRADTNAWMIRFFGTWNPLKDDEVIEVNCDALGMAGGRRMMCNPRTYAKIEPLIRREALQAVNDWRINLGWGFGR